MAETGTAAEQLPRVFTGTHDNLDGADGHTAWPNDVPPGQDDTWFPLRDDPWKARRMEYDHRRLLGHYGGVRDRPYDRLLDRWPSPVRGGVAAPRLRQPGDGPGAVGALFAAGP